LHIGFYLAHTCDDEYPKTRADISRNGAVDVRIYDNVLGTLNEDNLMLRDSIAVPWFVKVS